MKNFLLLFLFLISIQINAQLTYELRVVDNQQRAVSNLPILLKETSTKEKIKLRTDGGGNVLIELKSGNRWIVSIGKMYNYKVLDVPQSGYRKSRELMTYDLERWERENRPMPDRSTINFQTVKKTVYNSTRPTKAESVVKLHIKRANKKPLTDFVVNMTSLKTKTIYIGKTDNQGTARFLVPFGDEYEIDIDGIESFKYIEVLNQPMTQNYGFTYEPTDITETSTNDTIVQMLPNNPIGTSARFLYTVHVKSRAGDLLEGEQVYIRMLKSKKVYVSTTNKFGQVSFLLPKKKKYLVDLDFQKDINVIDLKQSLAGGIGEGNMYITYRPNPKLQYPEQYIPTVEDLLINEFNNFVKKQIPPPEKGKGLRMVLKWGNELINGKSKEAVLEIGFSADKDESNAYGPPINVSFVVDKSGSMAGYDRIEELQKSLINFVGSLRPNDIASLIIFDTEPELLLEAGKLQGRKDEFISLISSIIAGGGTNIYKGMVLGYEQVLKNMQTKGTNRLVLLTDGYGETEVKVIVDKSKEYNAKGIELSAIGVGEGYNQALLKLLSTHGGGLFQHVGNANNLQETFRRELSGMLYPVAKDVKVEILYNNKIVFKQLYGFPFEQGKGQRVKMELNNVYPGLNKLALVKFDLNKPDKSIENQPVVVKMDYFDYRLNKIVTTEEKAYLKWQEATGELELIREQEQKMLYAIAIMNQSLKVMADAFSADDFAKAEDAVKRAMEQIEELYPDAKQKDVENLYRTLKEYADILKQYKLNKYKKRYN
jgi:hypothetical protein